MGIHGLWQVLEPTGRPVNIHSLRGKVLAIDVSIWLHQLVKGFRDKDGNPLPNAHLLGVFHRVCKLLNYGVKPVFVFDGGVPALKRQTLATRRQRKLESLDKAEISRQKILSAYLRQQLQRQAKVNLPPSLRMQAQIDDLSKKSPSASPKKRKTGTSPSKTVDALRDNDTVDRDLEDFRAALIAKLEDDVDEVGAVKNSVSDTDDDDQSDAGAYQYGVDYSENFSIIQASSFDSLPLETQHEILFEMQESRKMNSWGKFDKMPKDLQSFSSFQMDRLVKRRTLQKKIQSVQQEMGQRHIHVQNLDDLLKMDYGDFDKNEKEIKGSRDDGFVLIKSQPPAKGNKENPKPGTSRGGVSSNEPEIITIDDFIEATSSDNDSASSKENGTIQGAKSTTMVTDDLKNIPSDEEDADLKLAIELSLRDAMNGSEESKIGSEGERKVGNCISESQKSTLNQYQICKETKDDVETHDATNTNESNCFEKSSEEFSVTSQYSQMTHCAKFLDTVGFHLPHSKSLQRNESEIVKDAIVSVISSKEQSKQCEDINDSEEESDDDFEEVEIAEPNPISSTRTTNTVATIDLLTIANVTPGEDDMFADVFSTVEERHSSNSVDKGGNDSKDTSTTEIIDAPLTVAVSPHKENFETKWDSDSEIEADLLEMVIKESSTAANLKNEPRKLSETKESITISSDNDVASTSSQNCANPNTETHSKDDTKFNNPPRMITADYMQAQEQLNSKLGKLHSEMGQHERIATSISDQMQIETQELIALFGIPYIISPTEAESQCAFLDRACLTEGTITDDSDVWLFGGQRVYKNFFSQGQKHVELYQAADIHRVLNLDREKLIVLAIMIGSDYSDGIQGVGPVLALEILSEFTSTALENFEILLRFREWWDEIQTKPLDVFSGSKIKEKLRKLRLRPGFPNKTVFDAFINPTIDTSTEAFKWGNPDLDAIRNYTKQKFGWEQSKCDSFLLPVLKKRQCELDQSRQLTLDSYISFGKMPSLDGGKRKKGSKRLETAVKRLKRVGVESHELNLSSESDSEEETDRISKKSTSKKEATKRVVKRKQNRSLCVTESVDERRLQEQEATASSSNAIAGTSGSGTTANLKRLVRKKAEIIPQRVQSESDKIKNKQKAIEIFKQKKK